MNNPYWAKFAASILIIILVSSCTDKEISAALYGSSYTNEIDREQERKEKESRIAEFRQFCTRLSQNPQLSILDGLLEWSETSAGRFRVMGVNRVPTDDEQ